MLPLIIETDHVKKLFVTLTGGRTLVTLRTVKRCVARREPKTHGKLGHENDASSKDAGQRHTADERSKTRRRRTQIKGHGERRPVRTQRQVLGRESVAPALYLEVK